MIDWRTLAGLVSLLVAAVAFADEGGSEMPRSVPTRVESNVVAAAPRDCKPGLYRQPTGPFAVLLFCEDAQASHAGIIYLENMRGPINGSWAISDRFWQEPQWAADVTAFVWSQDGKTLFISTAGIYGEVGVFRLQLLERRATRLFPTESLVRDLFKVGEACAAEIKSLRPAEHVVVVEVTNCLKSESRTLHIPDAAG
jgi:hypothetical protein